MILSFWTDLGKQCRARSGFTLFAILSVSFGCITLWLSHLSDYSKFFGCLNFTVAWLACLEMYQIILEGFLQITKAVGTLYLADFWLFSSSTPATDWINLLIELILNMAQISMGQSSIVCERIQALVWIHLALPDDSNPTTCEFFSKPKWFFIAQSLYIHPSISLNWNIVGTKVRGLFKNNVDFCSQMLPGTIIA